MSRRRSIAGRVKEGLLLTDAQASAKAYGPAQRARVQELSRAVRRRLGAALELREDGSTPAALSLIREASALSITALCTARGEHDGDGVLPVAEAWSRLGVLIESGALPAAPPAVAPTAAALAGADPLSVDRMTPSQARELRLTAESAVDWIGRQYEARSVRQIKVQRVLRIGGLAAGLVVVLGATVASAVSPTDIALHKPVAASGHYNPSPDPSHAVDGVKDGHVGVHTSLGDYPWIRVDLQGQYSIKKVVVANRGDGYFDEILPVALSLSVDGKHWKEVAVRKTHYTEKEPWVQKLDGEAARYVRIQVKKKHAYAWASEIEVYGSKR